MLSGLVHICLLMNQMVEVQNLKHLKTSDNKKDNSNGNSNNDDDDNDDDSNHILTLVCILKQNHLLSVIYVCLSFRLSVSPSIWTVYPE